MCEIECDMLTIALITVQYIYTKAESIAILFLYRYRTIVHAKIIVVSIS